MSAMSSYNETYIAVNPVGIIYAREVG